MRYLVRYPAGFLPADFYGKEGHLIAAASPPIAIGMPETTKDADKAIVSALLTGPLSAVVDDDSTGPFATNAAFLQMCASASGPLAHRPAARRVRRADRAEHARSQV